MLLFSSTVCVCAIPLMKKCVLVHFRLTKSLTEVLSLLVMPDVLVGILAVSQMQSTPWAAFNQAAVDFGAILCPVLALGMPETLGGF